MRIQNLIKAFLCGAVAVVSAASEGPELKSHTAYTQPLKLKQGEVTNTFHKLKIPVGPLAVYRFEADVVEKNEAGEFVPTPLYDAYLHHHVVGSSHKEYEHQADRWTPMKPKGVHRAIGFGAGTESRGTPQQFYHPYAFHTTEGEDTWIANVHVLNTRKMTPKNAGHCLECPCTSEDTIVNGKLNNEGLPWDQCNAELVYENNTACFLETYYGGLRCCEHGEFCLEQEDLDKTQESTYYLRYTIYYSDVVPESRELYLASCCDASGNFTHHGAIEYDIPECDESIHPGCVHTLSTRQYIGGAARFPFAGGADVPVEDKEVEVLYAVGHQHRGGMGISLYKDSTGELICNSLPTYGTGDEILNESGYIVAMSTCTFDPPLRMKTTDVVRIVSLYNNTIAHTGVMSLWYLALADAPVNDNAVVASENMETISERSSVFAPILLLVSLVGLVAFVVIRYKSRQGYHPLAN